MRASPTILQPTRPTPQGSAKATARWPLLYGLIVFAWVFDFRSEGAGQALAVQAVFLAIYGLALGLFLINEKRSWIRVRWMAPLLAAGTLYLGIGVAVGLAYDQDIYAVLRNATSVVVFLSAAYATSRAVIASDPRRIKVLLTLACLAYAVFAFVIYNRMSGGIDVTRVRHQIIGGSAVAGLGLIALSVMFRIGALQIIAALINLAILLLSVTRTYLLVLLAQGAYILVEARRLVTPRLAMLLLVGGGIVSIAFVYAQSQILRWGDRLGAGGGTGQRELQTWFTRISEWDFMYGQWTASPLNFLFGSGLGARTLYFYPPELGGFSESMVGFGHNQHLSLLFTAGAVGGIPLLAVLWFNGWMALRFLRRVARNAQARNDLVFLGCWGATIVLGTLVADTLSATFSLRGASLWYGVGTGLLLGVQACFDPENARSTGARAQNRDLVRGG